MMIGPIPNKVDFSNPLYLGVSFEGAAEMTPRAQVTPSAYAFYSLNSGNANQAFHALSADTSQYAVIADTARNIDASHNNAVLNINGQSQNVILHYYDNITSSDSSLAITTVGGSPLKEANLSVKAVASAKLSPPAGINAGQTIQWNGSTWVPATMNVPVGTVMAYAGALNGTLDTTQWLPCDGRSLSSTTYPELWNALGAANGGSGTNFNLPDYRGLFLRGANDMSTAMGNRTDTLADPDNAVRFALNAGGNVGNKVGSVQGDILKSHNHIDGQCVPWITALYGYYVGSGNQDHSGAVEDGYKNYPYTSTTGGNETRPKNAYVNWIIKTRP